MPESDAAAADAMKARRFAMLQRFMSAARSALRPVFSFYSRRSGRRGKGKSKGKASSSGRAFQFRKEQNRGAKRSAFLSRLSLGVRPKNPTPRPPDRQRRTILPPTAQP